MPMKDDKKTMFKTPKKDMGKPVKSLPKRGERTAKNKAKK
jgi:hypothetical protein